MNESDIKFLRQYFKAKIRQEDITKYHTFKFNDLEFSLEGCGLYTLNFICDNHSVNYMFSSQRITCGCSNNKPCIHIESLEKYLAWVLTKKEY